MLLSASKLWTLLRRPQGIQAKDEFARGAAKLGGYDIAMTRIVIADYMNCFLVSNQSRIGRRWSSNRSNSDKVTPLFSTSTNAHRQTVSVAAEPASSLINTSAIETRPLISVWKYSVSSCDVESSVREPMRKSELSTRTIIMVMNNKYKRTCSAYSFHALIVLRGPESSCRKSQTMSVVCRSWCIRLWNGSSSSIFVLECTPLSNIVDGCTLNTASGDIDVFIVRMWRPLI
jgi:hypothetical protein